MPDVMMVTVSVKLQKSASKHKKIKIRALKIEQPTG